LPLHVRRIIGTPDTRVLVSAATIWEIAIKHRAGRWSDSGPLLEGIAQRLTRSGFAELPISFAHAQAAGMLEGSHKDPFDRMLIAQARSEGVAVVTRDAAFGSYGVPVIWK
jgi:PIN domain nuclease of toxin-antitoxin system